MQLSNYCFALLQEANLIERIWYYVNYKIPIGNFSVSAASFATGIIIFLIAITVSNALQSYLQRRLSEDTQLDPGIRYTLFRLAHYLIVTVGGLLALRAAFSLDLTSLAVLFTALSVGIGFGLQYIAGDIASGFILLFERPVRIGDFVTVTSNAKGDVEGKVESINLRTSVVVTNDQLTVIVPNSKLVSQTFINWTYTGRDTRLRINVGVDYGSDIELVTKTLLKAAEGVGFVLDEPQPTVQFVSFGDSSLNFLLLIWTNQPHRHPKIRSDINYNISRLFAEAGIGIPFPQRDVHIYNHEPKDGKEKGITA